MNQNHLIDGWLAQLRFDASHRPAAVRVLELDAPSVAIAAVSGTDALDDDRDARRVRAWRAPAGALTRGARLCVSA